MFYKKILKNKLETLGKAYATDLKVELNNKDILLTWTKRSYNLGSMKFCYMLIHSIHNICDVEFSNYSLFISNIKDYKKFVNIIKELK